MAIARRKRLFDKSPQEPVAVHGGFGWLGSTGCTPRLSFRPSDPGACPGRDVPESSNPWRSDIPTGGGYWIPARREPGVAGLAWPG